MTLEPNGTASARKQFQVGSTPTGVLSKMNLGESGEAIMKVKAQVRSTRFGAVMGGAVVGAIMIAAFHFGFDPSVRSPQSSTAAEATTGGAPPTSDATAAADGVVPLAKDIGHLPLRDPLVVSFPRDWAGPGERP